VLKLLHFSALWVNERRIFFVILIPDNNYNKSVESNSTTDTNAAIYDLHWDLSSVAPSYRYSVPIRLTCID
jgi:hypothetical protein